MREKKTERGFPLNERQSLSSRERSPLGFDPDLSGPVGAVSNRTGADLACLLSACRSPDLSGQAERDSINRDLEYLINSTVHYISYAKEGTDERTKSCLAQSGNG